MKRYTYRDIIYNEQHLHSIYEILTLFTKHIYSII